EGPIAGTVVFFVLQQNLSQYNAWYLIILGLVAIAIALWAPRGLWGAFADYTHIRLFPVGYWLWPAGQDRSRRPRLAGRPGRRGRGGHGGPGDLAGRADPADRGGESPAVAGGPGQDPPG